MVVLEARHRADPVSQRGKRGKDSGGDLVGGLAGGRGRGRRGWAACSVWESGPEGERGRHGFLGDGVIAGDGGWPVGLGGVRILLPEQFLGGEGRHVVGSQLGRRLRC